MRKSHAVPLTLLAAAAFTVSTGCDHPTQVRNCVDQQGRIVPDNSCNHAAGGGGGVPVPYRYVYGGASGGHIGDTVVGGSSEPEANARVVSGDTGEVVRGGFGGEGGDGHGGEGGHGGGE
ncbi:MAG: hypothetical protein WB524_18940 [Acidobacteriaceae bacterium]|jgi:hypothetical protein